MSPFGRRTGVTVSYNDEYNITVSDADDTTETTRVSQKGQTTIPKPVRDELGIEPGDTVEWETSGEAVRLSRRTSSTTKGAAFDDASEAAREEWVKNANDRLKQRREAEWDGSDG